MERRGFIGVIVGTIAALFGVKATASQRPQELFSIFKEYRRTVTPIWSEDSRRCIGIKVEVEATVSDSSGLGKERGCNHALEMAKELALSKMPEGRFFHQGQWIDSYGDKVGANCIATKIQNLSIPSTKNKDGTYKWRIE